MLQSVPQIKNAPNNTIINMDLPILINFSMISSHYEGWTLISFLDTNGGQIDVNLQT